jgi:serine protease Do
MQDVQLLDAIERFLRGEMSTEEMASFEQLRKSNPEVDQKVVEHTMFLQQMDQFADWKNFKSTLHDVHNQLLETGDIKEEAPRATVIQIWKKIQTGYGSCRLHCRYHYPPYCQHGHLLRSKENRSGL